MLKRDLHTFLCKYCHPLDLIEELATTAWPQFELCIDGLDAQVFQLLEIAFNLVAIVSIHCGFQSLSWTSFVLLMFLLGVCKRLAQMQREKLDRRAEGDGGEQNLRPGLNWLNKIIKTLWMNHRAYARFVLLNEIWPLVKARQHSNVDILDLNIGDQPLRVLEIDSVDHKNGEMIVDFEIAYQGNASVKMSYLHENVKVSTPVTIQQVSIGKAKVRVILKQFLPQIPFIGGIQVFFLETPDIKWHMDMTEAGEFPALKKIIQDVVDNHIIERFVLPNRFSMPIQLSKTLTDKLNKLNLSVQKPDAISIALHHPVGIVRVSVVKAENLRPSDLSCHQCKNSENLNPFKPSKFGCTNLPPKRGGNDAYAIVSVGKETHMSPVVYKNLNPQWNYTCEFAVEYFHKALVKIELFNDDRSVKEKTSDDFLGRVTEKIKRIKTKGVIEGWYNSEIYQGRVYLKFKWIPLKTSRPQVDHTDPIALSGVLCVHLGKVRSRQKICPTCYLSLQNKDGTIEETKSLDATSNSRQWRFDEGKVFRIRNFGDREIFVELRMFDHASDAFIGRRKFSVNSLLTRNLDGFYKLPNPQEDQTKQAAISLYSQILFAG